MAEEGERGSSDDEDDEEEDLPSVSMATTCTAYSLIETAHPVFGRVKGLWNSPTESHREVCQWAFSSLWFLNLILSLLRCVLF